MLGEEQGANGVFQDSALESVELPSTLRRIECRAFMRCGVLRTVRLPGRLEFLGRSCFAATGLESVELPASLRTVSQASFALCKSLRTAKFGPGLEVLGTDERADDGGAYLGVFEKSALRRVELPPTLRRMQHNAFRDCRDLKGVRFPEGLEVVGGQLL